MTKMAIIPENYKNIRAGIVELLKTARSAAARNVNALMTATYWEIGRRIVQSEQAGDRRAEYGELLIKRLAKDLSASFGRGFGPRNLAQMRSFYLAWSQGKILQTLSAKSSTPISFNKIQGQPQLVQDLANQFPLPWSAYVRLLSVKRPEARTFYETEALRSGWSVRQLDRQIGSQFYERIALSQNKAAMLERAENSEPSDLVTAEETIKDPFVLEFLDLKDEYSESDLEEALIQHLTDFLLELGDDFAFLARQRRLRIDDKWFRIDLLFFHRRLRCLVVIDLKVRQFSYADAGQMHLYLNYATEHWMKPGENPPIGLILCAEKGASEAHYTLDNLPNKVLAAEYQTVLPEERLIAEELERSRRELEKRASVTEVQRVLPDVNPRNRADD
jgi:predicted nuclease of restriction endonuclease-like (RecB) superfamily